MENKEIIDKIRAGVHQSKNWYIYHHLNDKIGNPALMLRQDNAENSNAGVNIDTFKGYAYLFLDNGTPAEPGESFSLQNAQDYAALQELMTIVKPFLKGQKN